MDAQIAALKQKLAARPRRLTEQEKALVERWKAGELAWHFQRPEEAHSLHGAVLNVYNDKPVDSVMYVQDKGAASLHSDRHPGDGLIVASGPNPDNETYVVTLRPGAGSWTELGVDVVDDESLPGNRVSRGADRFLLTGVEAVLQEPGEPARKLTFSTALGDKTTNNGMPATAAIDNDPETGWGVALGESSDPFLALRFAEKITTTADSRIVVTLRHDSTAYRRAVIGRFRLALSSGEYSWPADGTAAKRVKEDKTRIPRGSGIVQRPFAGHARRPGRNARETQACAEERDSRLLRMVVSGDCAVACRTESTGRRALYCGFANRARGDDGCGQAARDADSSPRQLDGRFRRDRGARDPRNFWQAEYRRTPRQPARSGQLDRVARTIR